MNRNTITKLKKEIALLEKKKQSALNKKMKEILKSDPEIHEYQEKINSLNKFLKAREEMEQKVLELDLEIENQLN